jgi:hypothetical protein
MKNNTTGSLLSSEDAELRAIKFDRLLRTERVDNEGKQVLLQALPSLELGQLLHLVSSHGDLGAPALIVDRFIALLPSDEMGLWGYFGYYNLLETLADKLGHDAYADFAEKAFPRTKSFYRRQIAQHMRACSTFDELVRLDGKRDNWSVALAPEPIAVSLLDDRRDERRCRVRVAALIDEASHGELLRLEGLLHQTRFDDLTRQAQQRLLDGFELKTRFADNGGEDPDAGVNYCHRVFVKRWLAEPAADRAARLGWMADFLEKGAEAVGPMLTLNLRDWAPPEIINGIIAILIDRGRAPSNAGPVLRERLEGGSIEAWNSVFLWCERLGHAGIYETYRDQKAIVTAARLPKSAPDEFDEAFLRCAFTVIAHERQQIQFARSRDGGAPVNEPDESEGLFDYALLGDSRVDFMTRPFHPLLRIETVVDRLLELDLTPTRARRIARLIKDHRRLLHHPRIGEVAAVAGEIEAEMLLPFEKIDLEDRDQVTLYRHLAGAAADDRLRAHARAALLRYDRGADSTELIPRPSGWVLLRWFEDLIEPALRAELRARLVDAPLRVVLDWWDMLPTVVDDRLIGDAAQRHLDENRRWDRVYLIPQLRRFVEQRVPHAEDDDELFFLLDWLEAQGFSRAAKLDAVLAAIEKRPPTRNLHRIVALLPTRSSWEQHGPRLLRALVRRDAWTMVYNIWYALHESISNAPAAPDGTAARSDDEIVALITATHLAFATVLLELASAAAEAHDEARLLALLNAVLKLDPPPPIVRHLRQLAKQPGLSDRARERIDLGTTLFKSASGRTAAFGPLMNAAQMMIAASTVPVVVLALEG